MRQSCAISPGQLVPISMTAAGYFGGWFDLAAQRLIDIWIALPALLGGAVFVERVFALLQIATAAFVAWRL